VRTWLFIAVSLSICAGSGALGSHVRREPPVSGGQDRRAPGGRAHPVCSDPALFCGVDCEEQAGGLHRAPRVGSMLRRREMQGARGKHSGKAAVSLLTTQLRLKGGGTRQMPAVVSAHGRADASAPQVQVSTLQLARRASWLAVVFALPLLTAPLAVLLTPFREVVWYRLLAFCMGRSGAAFIKWAQWASVRPDIFPQPLCDVLANLHSGAPMHSWAYTRQQLVSAIGGGPLEGYFDKIETRAFASGSIAQVYRAQVRACVVTYRYRCTARGSVRIPLHMHTHTYTHTHRHTHTQTHTPA